MTTFHIALKSAGPGNAVPHAAYIAREGKYGKKLKDNDITASEYGNLPAWSGNNPKKFWSMADKHERANGAAYREFEVALPVELALDQQNALVKDFIAQQLGTKPFQYAIHAPMAALANVLQPHAHIMFSDRVEDGIEREADQHFRRYNAKNPELGGCKKDSGGKDPLVLRNALVETRKAWADLVNSHLEQGGHEARVDHRSNQERGINAEPGRHLGQARVKRLKDQGDAS